jgi:hypothetical protein
MKRVLSSAHGADPPPQSNSNEALPQSTDSSNLSKRLKMDNGDEKPANGSEHTTPKVVETQDNRSKAEAPVKKEYVNPFSQLFYYVIHDPVFLFAMLLFTSTGTSFSSIKLKVRFKLELVMCCYGCRLNWTIDTILLTQIVLPHI